MVKILLFGDQNCTQLENAFIINSTIKYLVDSEIQWSTSVVVHNLNDLNVFVITCFFTAASAYDKLLGFSFCISQVLSVYFPFALIQVL